MWLVLDLALHALHRYLFLLQPNNGSSGHANDATGWLLLCATVSLSVLAVRINHVVYGGSRVGCVSTMRNMLLCNCSFLQV